MKDVFNQHYKEQYVKAGLLDQCGGELQHVISDAATMQIIRWTDGGFGMAAHNVPPYVYGRCCCLCRCLLYPTRLLATVLGKQWLRLVWWMFADIRHLVSNSLVVWWRYAYRWNCSGPSQPRIHHLQSYWKIGRREVSEQNTWMLALLHIACFTKNTRLLASPFPCDLFDASPHGCSMIIKEFEASHGTVADMWEAHQKGFETSLNPLGIKCVLI